MPQLLVDFRQGFDGELVILRIDGNEVHRSCPKTDLPTGFAGSHRFPMSTRTGRSALEVEIPDKGIFGVCGFTVFEDVTIGLSLEANGILSFQNSGQ